MQPAPVGALCAVHVGIAATTTCSRCGNFMCATCAEFGEATQCPSCRALSGGEFPLDATSDFSAMWGYAVAAWQRELGMLLVAVLIFLAISMAGGLVSNVISQVVNAVMGLEVDSSDPLGAIPRLVASVIVGQLIGTLVSIVAQGIALVGLYRVLVDVLLGRKADLARMFSQLHLLPRYLVMQLIFFVALTIPLLAAVVALGFAALRSAGIDWQHLQASDFERLLNPQLFGFFFLFMLVILVGAIVLLPVTLFAVPELVVGQCSAMEAITRAWNLGSGQRLRLFGYSFVSGAVVLAGLLLCFVGLIPALPLSYLLLLALFLGLRKSSALPPLANA